MPLPLARRAVAISICFCWGLFLAIPAAVFGQTNYYAAYGTEYPIIGSLPGDQVFPDVAVNTNGGYVVWQDNITDPVGEGISAMQVNSTLSGSGDIFAVNTLTTNNEQHARVALLKGGGAAFVWEGGVQNVNQQVYARFLNAQNLWLNNTNVLVSTYSGGNLSDPAVATLANGNVIVVWSSFNQASATSMMDVYGQILTTNGTAVGTNFLINQFTPYNQREPAVATFNNGGFVVTWISEQQNVVGVTNSADSPPSTFALPSVDVYARLYTISNTFAVPSSGEFKVDTGTSPCSSPAVAVAVDNGYMITWCARDMVTAINGWDIYERSFTNANGGQVNRVNSYTYGDQYNPRISVVGGNYLIVWTSLGEDGSREGVFGQFVNEGDVLAGGQFLVNTTTVGQQMHPAVASDGYDQYLAVWTSFTTTNGFDLYAQRFINSEAVLEPMAAPYVWAPFVVSNGVYQPELVVSWPPVQGLSVSNYEVYADGATTSTATVATNGWTATYGVSSTNSTHSFALTYVTALGFQSPISPSASGTTWSGLNYFGIPYEWMSQFFGGYYGGTYHTNAWPPINLAPPGSPAGSPTLMQLFLTGGIPYDPSTWMATSLTKTSQGLFLSWNTQPGMTYQVQQLAPNMAYYVDVGAPRFESGTSDSVYVGNSKTGFYRVLLLRQ